jgi:hypothetical protein
MDFCVWLEWNSSNNDGYGNMKTTSYYVRSFIRKKPISLALFLDIQVWSAILYLELINFVVDQNNFYRTWKKQKKSSTRISMFAKEDILNISFFLHTYTRMFAALV